MLRCGLCWYCRHGCRISAGLQSTDGRLSSVSLLARGRSLRNYSALDRVAVAALVAQFAGCYRCRGAVRGVAPEDPCPPCLLSAGLLVGSTVKAASYAGNEVRGCGASCGACGRYVVK